MRRFTASIVAAWIAGTTAATAVLWVKSGIAAFRLLPTFAVLLGLWLLCVGGIAVFLRRREGKMAVWMYSAAVVCAVFAALLFFVLFAYPLMVSVPLGMLVAAPTFHAAICKLPASDRSA